MKVTTTPRDCDKVNQIVPIMQEHLGPVMNLARIKLLAFVLHALCIVQTVSLHKIASAMPTSVERDSNLRRLQRFLARYAFNLDLFALLPVKTGLVLSLDRTNWKFGKVNINILMLGVTYKGVAFPLLFTMLDKRGNSNWKERTQLIDRFIRLFGVECIDSLVADRESVAREVNVHLVGRIVLDMTDDSGMEPVLPDGTFEHRFLKTIGMTFPILIEELAHCHTLARKTCHITRYQGIKFELTLRRIAMPELRAAEHLTELFLRKLKQSLCRLAA